MTSTDVHMPSLIWHVCEGEILILSPKVKGALVPTVGLSVSYGMTTHRDRERSGVTKCGNSFSVLPQGGWCRFLGSRLVISWVLLVSTVLVEWLDDTNMGGGGGGAVHDGNYQTQTKALNQIRAALGSYLQLSNSESLNAM